MFLKNLNKLLLLLFIFFVAACANIVAPTGGEKDFEPPKVVRSSIKPLEINIKPKQIRFTFDEYIQVAGDKLVVSPNLKTKPTVTVKDKSIIIDIKDTLLENTTYTFNFGNSITDITEKNPYVNFKIVFSTGSFIDSLRYSGRIFEQETGKPAKEWTVGLYERFIDDSALLNSTPIFYTMVNESGSFEFENLPNRPFQLFAFNDVNKNLKMDLNEAFAFSDTLIQPDTNTIQAKLYGFKAAKIGISIEEFRIEHKQQVRFVLSNPKAKFQFQILEPNILENKDYFLTNSRDTVRLFLKNELDSAIVKFNFPDYNDSIQYTLNLKGGRAPVFYSAFLPTTQNTIPDSLYTIFYSLPIDSINLDSMSFSIDTTILPVKYSFNNNTLFFTADERLKYASNYNFTVKKGAFVDIYGNPSAPMNLAFLTQNEDSYGSLIFTNPDSSDVPSRIIQFCNEKYELISTHVLKRGESVQIANLKPGSYFLRVLEDENGNLLWDSGTLIPRKQAEKLIYFSEAIKVRADWELEIDISIVK